MTWDPASQRTPYDVLGIDRSATAKELRAAYRKLSRTRHPDRGGTNEAFQELTAANTLLSDPLARSDYDHAFDLHAAEHAAPPRPGRQTGGSGAEYQWNTQAPQSPFPAPSSSTPAEKAKIVEEWVIYIVGFFATAMVRQIFAGVLHIDILPVIPFIAYFVVAFMVHRKYAASRKRANADGASWFIKKRTLTYIRKHAAKSEAAQAAQRIASRARKSAQRQTRKRH